MSIRSVLVALAIVAGAATAATAKVRVQEQQPTGFIAEVEGVEAGTRSGPSCVWHNFARPSNDGAWHHHRRNGC